MGLDMRKPVLGGLGTTKAETNLRIHAVRSALLLFAYWKVSFKRKDWFESRFVDSPEDRFCRVEAQIK